MEETIGERIRALRQKRFKGQLQAAVALGLSVPAYSKIETGKIDISVSRLFEIAELFEVTRAYLLHGDLEECKLAVEIKDLRQQMETVSEYCILLQRRLVRAYEEMEGMKEKVG